MNEITQERKSALVEIKIALWENTVYDAQLDVEVAELLDDIPAVQQAKARMKNALKVVGFLRDKLTE